LLKCSCFFYQGPISVGKKVLHSFNHLDSQRFGLKEVLPSFSPQLAITNENHLHYSVVAIACKLFNKMSQLPTWSQLSSTAITNETHSSPDSLLAAAPNFPPRRRHFFTTTGKIIRFCILVTQFFPQCSDTIGM
jgi:hypothetical protein